jgi:hypothetical protein
VSRQIQRAQALTRLRLVGAAAVTLFVCKGQAMADKRDHGAGAKVPAPIEADITLTEGPGAVGAGFKLRGSVLTILLPRGEDGARAGLYRLNLDKHDALVGALANLPASAAGPPAVMGMPAAAFAIRVHGKEQHLVAHLPTVDPHVDKILVELGRYEKASKDKPVLAISLAVAPMVPAKAKEPQTVTVRIATAGERGAEVSFNPALLKLQAAAEPQPAPAGVTPLPPEWDQVSAPLAGSSPQTLKAGTTSDVKLTVNVSAPEYRWLRAVYDGNATFRAPDQVEDVRLGLVSKAVRFGAAPAGSKK